MFPTSQSPVSSLLRRGIDRAVQFATLGEYAIEDPPAIDQRPAIEERPRPSRRATEDERAIDQRPAIEDRPRPSRRRTPVAPTPVWRPERTASQVGRATAAARRRGEPAKPIPTRAAVRSLAMRPGPSAAAPRMRTRAGQPAPRPQPCIAP
jgi:hypothetical protein